MTKDAQNDQQKNGESNIINLMGLTPDEVYQETLDSVDHQIKWYTKNASKKKWWAQKLRLSALLLLGIGFILPVLLDIVKLPLNVPGSVASVILALGTGLIALDRYMGHSSGWMRFIKTELLLKSYLSRFQYDTYMERLNWKDGKPNEEQRLSFVQRCASFRNQVWTITNDETLDWIEEFRNSLRALDEKYEEMMPQSKPGSIELTVQNGEQYEDGWEFYIDGRLIKHHHGNSAAEAEVPSGNRVVRVMVKGKPQTSRERIVKIEPGQISEISIDLPAPDAG